MYYISHIIKLIYYISHNKGILLKNVTFNLYFTKDDSALKIIFTCLHNDF